MKILQIAKYYPPAPGGIESFVQDISHAIVAKGHDNCVLAHRLEAGEPQVMQGAFGRVVRVPSFGEILYAPIAPTYPFTLRTLLRSYKPDILLVHMPNVSGFWPLFFPIPCPIVVFWHADVVFSKERRLLNAAHKGYTLFEKWLLRKSKRIIATSQAYLDNSASLQPHKDTCTVIPLGIDPNRIPDLSDAEVQRAKQKYLGTAKARYVYAAGRFSHYKGFDILVEAVAALHKGHPGLKVVIGGDGETRPEIIRLVESKSLKDAVICPGRLSDHDYWALMKGCDLFCLPSTEKTEAFGIVLLEAMSMGKPCVSTAIPGSGTGWVNQDRKTGRVVQPHSPRALADAIIEILDTPQTAKTYRAEALSRFKTKFTINSCASAILEACRQL